MTERDKTTTRKHLEEKRAELLASLERYAGNGPASSNRSASDLAVDMIDLERRRSLRANAEKLLAQVESALKRLEAGTYGLCEVCGQAISPDRLEVLPYAGLCIECQVTHSHVR